jgi:hypothetical protein
MGHFYIFRQDITCPKLVIKYPYKAGGGGNSQKNLDNQQSLDIVTYISLFFTFYIYISYPNFPIILCSPSDDKGWACENKEIELLFP